MSNKQTKYGYLYIVAAPSGAGKTSLVNALVETCAGLDVSVSYTTRPKRPGEIEGKHYYFVDKNEFQQMVNQGEFLEFAQVFDNFYGTSQKKVEQSLASGMDLILEIDWQGAQQVRKSILSSLNSQLTQQTCSGIFILPPSKQALSDRLHARGQDDTDVIARRMQDAIKEMSHYAEFDYLVVNDDFDQALLDLKSIIKANQLGFGCQSQALSGLIADLLA